MEEKPSDSFIGEMDEKPSNREHFPDPTARMYMHARACTHTLTHTHTHKHTHTTIHTYIHTGRDRIM